MKELTDILRNAPKNLYHYTDAGTLLGIIQNKVFWASYIRFMNDNTEYDLAKEILFNRLPTFIKSNIRDDSSLVKRIKLNFEDMIKRIDLFIISFSEKENDLDQWRAYGKSTPNYSLKIDVTSLSKNSNILIEKNAVKERISSYVYSTGCPTISKVLMPCIYDKEDQELLINEILLDSFNHIKNYNEDEIKFTDYIARRFVYYAPLIKNEVYKNEKEWRIVILFNEHDQRLAEQKEIDEKKKSVIKDNTLSLDKLIEVQNNKVETIDFRTNGSYFIPYYKMNFYNVDCIKKIYIGACPDLDTVYESVEYMLRKNGFEIKKIKDDKIIMDSGLAYRNW